MKSTGMFTERNDRKHMYIRDKFGRIINQRLDFIYGKEKIKFLNREYKNMEHKQHSGLEYNFPEQSKHKFIYLLNYSHNSAFFNVLSSEKKSVERLNLIECASFNSEYDPISIFHYSFMQYL